MPPLQNELPLHPREAEIRALEVMEAEVQKSGSGVPPLLVERTAENRQVLQWIGRFLIEEIPPALAMTDPSRYRMQTRLRMEMILRGYFQAFNNGEHASGSRS